LILIFNADQKWVTGKER